MKLGDYTRARVEAEAGLTRCSVETVDLMREKLEKLIRIIVNVEDKILRAGQCYQEQKFSQALALLDEAKRLNSHDTKIAPVYDKVLRFSNAEEMYQAGNDRQAMDAVRQEKDHQIVKAFVAKVKAVVQAEQQLKEKKPKGG